MNKEVCSLNADGALTCALLATQSHTLYYIFYVTNISQCTVTMEIATPQDTDTSSG